MTVNIFHWQITIDIAMDSNYCLSVNTDEKYLLLSGLIHSGKKTKKNVEIKPLGASAAFAILH